jgi:hypothetical protein
MISMSMYHTYINVIVVQCVLFALLWCCWCIVPGGWLLNKVQGGGVYYSALGGQGGGMCYCVLQLV